MLYLRTKEICLLYMVKHLASFCLTKNLTVLKPFRSLRKQTLVYVTYLKNYKKIKY